MAKSEYTDMMEESSSFKGETMVLLESMKSYRKSLSKAVENQTAKPSVNAVPSDTKEIINPEYKRIIGDFHITPQSRTYRELYQENSELLKENSALKEKLKSAESRVSELQKINEAKEKEIMLVRSKMPDPSQILAANRNNKKKAGLLKRLSHKPTKAVPESDRRKALTIILDRSQNFTDEQFNYLYEVLSKSKLPADAIAKLFDARLTVARMRRLYMMLCIQWKVKEDIGLGIKEAEEAADNDTVNSSSDNSLSAQSGSSSVNDSDAAPVRKPSAVIIDTAEPAVPVEDTRPDRLMSAAQSYGKILKRKAVMV